MKSFMRKLAGIALVAVVAAPIDSPAAPTPAGAPATLPVETFFNLPDMSEPLPSPDGSEIAMLVRNKAGRRQLAVLQAADLGKVRIVASFEQFDVSWARWADDKRLVFGLGDESESAWNRRGTGLYAIDDDGGNLRTLINFDGYSAESEAIKSRALDSYTYSLAETLHDGSGDVVVYHWAHTTPLGQLTAEWTGTVPLRLNTRTGVASAIVSGKLPDHVFEWAIDDHGRAHAATAYDTGETTMYVPDPSGAWVQRSRFATYGTAPDGFQIVGIGAGNKAFVTKLTPGPDGAKALYVLDLDTGRTEDAPIAHAKGFDIDGGLIVDHRTHQLLGVHYVADAAGTVWFDADFKAVQAKIDRRLPGLVNTINPAYCDCAQRVLVTSFSDRQPPLFFLFDRSDDTLIPIGAARPDVASRQMADTDFYRIKARDGHDIPVYVTKPHGKGPWPTVVLVHGGPWVRGWRWRWDAESQFLASRGYLVVKPEYRGSTGYGIELERSGDKQWGLKMQDDIADATLWAATQGFEDPKRTCIAGASYGGYATLMGLVRYGELYRCGVAWAAVTDINLMYDISWSDASNLYKTYGMPVLIGDQVKDAAQLKATSPLKQASRITRPLLLAHGGVDRRVPIDHATKLRDALLANHAPLTWIEYKDEAHGWFKPQTRVDFYTQMASFLDANIGSGYPATSP